MRRSTAVAGLLVLASTTASVSAKAIPVVQATAGPADGGPTIRRHLFWQFAEMRGEGGYGGIWIGQDSAIPNVHGIRSNVVQALRQLRLTNIRWPGGSRSEQITARNQTNPNNVKKIAGEQ